LNSVFSPVFRTSFLAAVFLEVVDKSAPLSLAPYPVKNRLLGLPEL
jgi:hypothetical protein